MGGAGLQESVKVESGNQPSVSPPAGLGRFTHPNKCAAPPVHARMPPRGHYDR